MVYGYSKYNWVHIRDDKKIIKLENVICKRKTLDQGSVRQCDKSWWRWRGLSWSGKAICSMWGSSKWVISGRLHTWCYWWSPRASCTTRLGTGRSRTPLQWTQPHHRLTQIIFKPESTVHIIQNSPPCDCTLNISSTSLPNSARRIPKLQQYLCAMCEVCELAYVCENNWSKYQHYDHWWRCRWSEESRATFGSDECSIGSWKSLCANFFWKYN